MFLALESFRGSWASRLFFSGHSGVTPLPQSDTLLSHAVTY